MELSREDVKMEREALYYEPLTNGKVKCLLCPQGCVNIEEGKTGFCRVRKNIKGKLYSIIYGECSSIALDPIEKKPLYHFHPGSQILSMGTYGCNFHCPWCQNWTISQEHDGPTHEVSPQAAVQLGGQQGSIGISYT